MPCWASSWPGLGPRVPSAANVQHHMVFIYQRIKSRGEQNAPSAPPRKLVCGDDGGRQPWYSWGFGFFKSVCVCEYPRLLSLTLPGLAPLAWLTWSNKQTILEPLDFSYPLLRCWAEGVFPNT